MEQEATVVTVPLNAICQLILLCGEDAKVDVPELITLTLNAIIKGHDHGYVLRTHGRHLDVDQSILDQLIRQMYDDICRTLTTHQMGHLYGLDLLKVTQRSIVIMVCV